MLLPQFLPFAQSTASPEVLQGAQPRQMLPETSASSDRNVSGVCMPPWFKHSPMGSPSEEIFTQLSCSQPSCWPNCQHQPVPRALCAFNKHRSCSPSHAAPSRLPQGIVAACTEPVWSPGHPPYPETFRMGLLPPKRHRMCAPVPPPNTQP